MIEKKLYILADIFGEPLYHGKEILFYCLNCKHHKKKLSFNLEKNCFKCWICEYSGKSISLAINRFGNLTHINSWNEIEGKIDFSTIEDFNKSKSKDENNIIYLPEEYKPLCSKEIGASGLKAKQYLFNRGLTKDDILWWKIGFCLTGKYANRIIVPSFNMNGDINYFIARSYIEKQISYLNPPVSKNVVFNELYIDWKKPITLVEGIFDAIKATNAIPALGSTLREDSVLFQKIAEKCSKIYIALDPDAKEKEEHIIETLLQYGIEVFKIKIKPFKDVAEMSRQEFLNRQVNAIRIDKSNDLEYIIRAMYE